MRFGGLIFEEWNTPEEWAAAAKRAGYSGVYFPVDYSAPLSLIDGYKKAAEVAKESLESGIPVRRLLLQKQLMNEETIDTLLDPAKLA